MINSLIQEHPKTAYLYPTLSCNLRCKMCYSGSYVGESPEGNNEMSLEKYREIISQLYEAGVRNFDISGGEPLIRRDIKDIVEHIKSYSDTMIYMVSNGTLIKKQIDKVKSFYHKVDRVYISIDSPYSEVHNEIRNSPNALEEAITGIETLRKEGFKNIGINFVMMNENQSQVIPLLDFAIEHGIKYVNILRLLDVSENGNLLNENLGLKAITNKYEEIQEWLVQKDNEGFEKELDVTVVLPGWILSYSRDLNRKPKLRENLKFNVEFDPIRGCPAFGNSIVISATGEITGCTAMVNIPEFHKGNVKKDSLPDVIDSWSKIRKKIIKDREEYLKKNKPCNDCLHWNVCRGGCPAVAYQYYGTVMEADPTCIVGIEKSI